MKEVIQGLDTATRRISTAIKVLTSTEEPKEERIKNLLDSANEELLTLMYKLEDQQEQEERHNGIWKKDQPRT